VTAVAAVVLAAYSPSAVMAILAETRAEGPLSRLSLSSVVANNLAIAVAFSIANTVTLGLMPGSSAVGGLATLAWQILMSLAIGALVGAVLALYITRVGRRNGLVIFAVLLVVAEAGFTAGIDPLLAGLAAGLFLENATPVSSSEIVRQMEPATLPTFVIFFGVVGAELHLAEFARVAHWALLVALVRAAGILLGVRLVRRRAGIDPALARGIPFGLMPQAGIALALSSVVETSFDPWGAQIATLLFGVVVVNELVGPILFRAALARANEIPDAVRMPISAPAASPASSPSP
jgi:Kef-type K+ transport system membrane component KefB